MYDVQPEMRLMGLMAVCEGIFVVNGFNKVKLSNN